MIIVFRNSCDILYFAWMRRIQEPKSFLHEKLCMDCMYESCDADWGVRIMDNEIGL